MKDGEVGAKVHRILTEEMTVGAMANGRSLLFFLGCALGIGWKPAFFYALLLVSHFQDRPERGEGDDSENRGQNEVVHHHGQAHKDESG